MNGYFIINNKKGTQLVIYPATGGGEDVRGNELKEYLDGYGINYDSTAINAAIVKAKKERVIIPLSNEEIKDIPEVINISVLADRMHVIARFIPPSPQGKRLTKEDIMTALQDNKVTYGIDENLINILIEQKEYCKDYEIATGKMPTAGRDATIKYYFNTDNSIRPTLNEDGSVDFFHLNNLNHCEKGDVLAEIIPKEKGVDGGDVFGTVLPAREVSDIEFKYGLNIIVSEDGTRLLSCVSGHVKLIDDTVFAADVYEVENVDTAVGNIDYTGNIQVNGNVCDNFSIKASGNVVVSGAVEAANIEAGGDIIIARGIYGQGRGFLHAKGNIIAKFLESCKVSSGGFVEAESILHSEVNAGTDVNVEAGKGFVTGSKIYAGNTIKVKNVGSPMGSDTILEVGASPKVKERYEALQKSVADRKKSIAQLKPVVEAMMSKIANGEKLPPQQVKYIQQLQTAAKDQEQALKTEIAELESFHVNTANGGEAYIDVSGNIYSGTKITISGNTLIAKDNIHYCRLKCVGADVKMTNR